jgi:hypothetical protein
VTPDRRLTRVELVATIVLAIAGVLTAWAALQSAKWSGDQATHFSEAGAARTDSARFDSRANSLIILDTSAFFQWAQAQQTEALGAAADGSERPDPAIYDPGDPSLSGYLFSLFRPDFRPRVQTWVDEGGAANPASDSPFMPVDDYFEESVPEAAESERYAQIADDKAAVARQDNQNSDDYVVTMVIFASVLFFAAVASKVTTRVPQNLMLVLSTGMLTWGVIRLVTLPIHAIP